MAEWVSYFGMCEPSAAAWLGDGWFVAGSDECNRLRRYRVGKVQAPDLIDLRGFTGFLASDIEGAAKVGGVVYWICSHSLTTEGREDKDERKIFCATKVVQRADGPWPEPVGQPILNLRPAILQATGAGISTLNIEGLAAGPDGGLLIGLRAPVVDGMALLLPMLNPGAVVQGQAAAFGPLQRVDLGGQGVRSMTRLANGRLAIMAGPEVDSDAGFHLYLCDGLSAVVTKVKTPDLTGLRPEAMFELPDGGLMVLSDDGNLGKKLGLKDSKDAEAPERRQFRSLVVDLPQVS